MDRAEQEVDREGHMVYVICFRPSTGSARFNIIRYKLLDIGPSILPSND
jgi:hypothetical protein